MRVLLAVDGSEFSYHAAEAVGHIASVKSLLALHVIDLPRLAYPMVGPEITQDLAMTVEQAMREEGERVLKHAMSHLSSHSTPVDKRLEEGPPAEVILSIAKQEHIDLIIIGDRGMGQLQKFVLGSTSHGVLMHAHCSILVTKSHITQFRKILLSIQSAEDAEMVRQFLMKHPFHRNTEITVFTVVPIPRSIWRAGVSAPESKIKHALESAEMFIDRVVAQLRDLPYAVTGLVGMGAPGETILEQESTTKPDLIVMGTHNPSAVSRFLMGSVSHTVLHQSTCSVLLVK